MKKIVSMLLCVVFVVTLFAGCGTQAPTAADTTAAATAATAASASTTAAAPAAKMTVKLATFTADLKAGLDKIKTDFESKNPNTTLDISYIPGDEFLNVIKAKFASNDAPDVFSMWGLSDFIDAGYLMPLDDTAIGKKLTPAGKSVVVCDSKDGKIYGIPAGVAGFGLIANTKVMADAGVTANPKNWKEFLDACAKIKAKGIAPIAFGDKDGVESQQFLNGAIDALLPLQDAKDIMAGKSVASKNKAIVAAAAKVKELKDKGYFVDGYQGLTLDQAVALVGSGKAAFLMNGEWGFDPIKKVDANVQLAMIPPAFADDGQSPGQVLSVFNFSENANTKVKAGVDQWWAYMMSDAYTANFGLPYACPIDGQKQNTSKEDQAYFAAYGSVNAASVRSLAAWPSGRDKGALKSMQDILAGSAPEKGLSALDDIFKK